MTEGRKKRRTGSYYAQIAGTRQRQALQRARHLENLEDDLELARAGTRLALDKIPPDLSLAFRGLDTVRRLETGLNRTARPDKRALPETVHEIMHIFDRPPGLQEGGSLRRRPEALEGPSKGPGLGEPALRY